MAADNPTAVTEASNSAHDGNGNAGIDPDCPFCSITSSFPPISPLSPADESWNPDRLSPPTYVLFSTEHVVAFLDIAPLTRGHVLVAPRRHRIKVGDLKPAEAAEIGRVLPLVVRSVLSATFPDIPHNEADYNVVQNNGPGAAQVIPHVHFHVIPRPPLDYTPPISNAATSSNGRYAPAKIPTGLKASYVQFGRGQRHELDDDDAVELVKLMRDKLRDEWVKHFSAFDEAPLRKEVKL